MAFNRLTLDILCYLWHAIDFRNYTHHTGHPALFMTFNNLVYIELLSLVLPPLLPLPLFIQSTPILLVEPGCGYLFSVCWSLSRPLVFAVGTGDGHVLIYDLKVCIS